MQRSDSKLRGVNTETNSNAMDESFDSCHSNQSSTQKKLQKRCESISSLSKPAGGKEPAERREKIDRQSSDKKPLLRSNSKTSTKAANRNRDVQAPADKPLNTSAEIKRGKRYMHPTDSSVKKSSRAVSANNRLTRKELAKPTGTIKQMALGPQVFSRFVDKLRQNHKRILRESKTNRAVQMIYFIFSPYILTLILMVKAHMNSKQAGKAPRMNKDDCMLVELKNIEIAEEQKKVAELK